MDPVARRREERILATYNSDEAQAEYAAAVRLLPEEEALFARYVQPGARVLDLGVGAGRTAPALAARAGTYLGVDVAARLVDTARRLHPGLDFQVGDAADLSAFADASFDVVVFSYNSIDCLPSTALRLACVAEMARVLAPSGVVLLSRHNPWGIVQQVRRDRPGALGELWVAGRAVKWTLRRLARHARHRAFWTGSGYVEEPTYDGGVVSYANASPRHVAREAAACGLAVRERLSSRFPGRGGPLRSIWYYYVMEHAR